MGGIAGGSRLRVLLFLAVVLTFSSPALRAQTAETPSESHEQGIPITDPLTNSKCGMCHMPDGKGNLSRISWMRSTPEGWEEAIKRMVRLNGLVLTPEEARHILRYLSDSHGLAPTEAAVVENYAEHRMTDEKFTDPDVRHACAACHEIERPLSWHRTPDDWQLLVDMHIAFFPSIEFTAFQMPMRGAQEESPNGQKPVPPVDKALAWIEKQTPLHTAAWSEWQASMAPPRLAGRWMVTGYEPGKGKFYGEMEIVPGADTDVFTTKTSLHYADGTEKMLHAAGSSIVYTGFQWRGRSSVEDADMAPGDPKTLREVMLVSTDQSEMKGRWFWGAYQEFGMDVNLKRASIAPAVLGTDAYSLRAGTTDDKVTIYGDHLPVGVTAAQIGFGAGVKVEKVLSATPGAITVAVDVEPHAIPGMRTVSVDSVVAPDALAVYQHVDFVKVTPVESLAHLGSEPHPKGYVQFAAVGYSFGPDGKPNTADDIDLGPMPATWKLQEFIATFGDDDVDFVGSIDAKTGLFTPASDGPDPRRRSMRNNYGDVYAVATVTPPGSTTPLTGQSYLIVAVPQYIRYDQPEVGQ